MFVDTCCVPFTISMSDHLRWFSECPRIVLMPSTAASAAPITTELLVLIISLPPRGGMNSCWAKSSTSSWENVAALFYIRTCMLWRCFRMWDFNILTYSRKLRCAYIICRNKFLIITRINNNQQQISWTRVCMWIAFLILKTWYGSSK